MSYAVTYLHDIRYSFYECEMTFIIMPDFQNSVNMKSNYLLGFSWLFQNIPFLKVSKRHEALKMLNNAILLVSIFMMLLSSVLAGNKQANPNSRDNLQSVFLRPFFS